MDKEAYSPRVVELLNELTPLTHHSDLMVYPRFYQHSTDTLYLEIYPLSAPRWAETCYQFAKHPRMKYDRDSSVYGIDGQPRVSYAGNVWARFLTDFEGGSKVALHIWAQQPSHADAEEQLGRLYGLFLNRDNLEPIEVFRKFL